MARKNIDAEVKELFTPIEITLEGVDYDITSIPSNVLDSMTDAQSDPRVLRTALAIMLGVEGKIFKKVDVKKLILASRYILSEMREQLQEYQSKNVPEVDPKDPTL